MVALTQTATCITGTVNQEEETGVVTYDDSTEKACSLGQSECYKQTMHAVVDGWPGMLLFSFISIGLPFIAITS